MSLSESDVAGWWDTQEGSGTSVADSKSLHDGTVSGATWTTGGPTNLPTMLDYDGNNDILDFNWNPNQAPGTACAWFIADSTTGSPFEVIFGEGNGGGGGGFDIFIEGNALKGRVRYTSIGDQTVQWTTGSGFSSGTLYFVALRWPDGTGDLEMFVDNVSVDTDPVSNSVSGGSVDLTVGSNQALSREFAGKIGQTVLLNKLASDAEIAEIWNGGAGITYDSLFGGGPGVSFIPKLSTS